MGRTTGFFIFLSILGLIDFYLYGVLKSFIRQSWPAFQKAFPWVFWSIPVVSLSIIILVFWIYPGVVSPKVRNFLVTAAFILYTAKFLMTLVLWIGEIWRFVQYAGQYIVKRGFSSQSTSLESPTIPRSAFLTQAALALGATQVGTMTWGILSGAHDYRVRRVNLHLPNLPKSFEGMTIAQISDIHTGSFFNKRAVQGGIDMLMATKPDAVFFTGDLVNNEAKEATPYIPLFSQVKAPLGVYSVLGNHDYGDYKDWGSLEAKRQNLQDMKRVHGLLGWKLLEDTHHKLQVAGDQIGILGIQNWGMGGFAKYGQLDRALQGTEELPVKLLLSHDPSHWRAQVLGKTSIDASFAGHTHGMQFGVELGDFKWSPAQYRYKEWAGLYQEEDQKLYVNRGFGYIGYPGRVGILPEITLFTLSSQPV
ncbi:MAG: metallophosphoesterase [Spirosomataceae bacterium]